MPRPDIQYPLKIMFPNKAAQGKTAGALTLASLLMLAGCQTPTPQGGTGTPAAPTGAACTPYGFAPTLPPLRRTGTAPTQIVQSICMNAQTYSGTASVTFDVAGMRDSVATCVPDGIHRFRMNAAVNGECLGPLGPVFTTTFAADHAGSVTRDNPACVMLSRIDFLRFNTVGPSETDTFVRNAAEDSIHLEFDFALADQMNKLFHGSTARPVTKANARCAGWRKDEVRPRP